MKLINYIVFCLSFLLFLSVLGRGNLQAQNLTVCSVEFPDTVTIGETATLKGYVLNTDNIAFNEDITINIDIEDTAPDGILTDGEVNDSITINQTNLAPNDSVYFEKDLLVSSQEFGAAGIDLVVVWPEVSGNDGVVQNEAEVQLTYVQEEAEGEDNQEAYDFLPDTIMQYIEVNYPDASIDHVYTVGSDFKIELDNEVELIFSIDGILQHTEEEDHHNYEDDDDDNYNNDDDDEGDNGNDDDDEGHDDYDDDDNGHDDDDDEGDDDNDDDNGHDDDDDDEGDNGHDEDDDDDKGHDNDEDKDYSDDDDGYEDDNWNREMETAPFKIITSKQTIQVIISDNNLKIEALYLYGLNGSFLQHLANQSTSATLSLSIQNSNMRVGVLQIYLKDDKGSIVEFNRKIILGQ